MAKKLAKKTPAAKSKPAAKPKAPKAKASAKVAAPKPPVKPAARKTKAVIASYMTRSVHTIGRDQSLDRAHELMNKYGIRHLPVLDAGELVGVLSQRDLYFVEMLDQTPRAEVKVEEAMTQDVFEVAADAPLAGVVDAMLKKKLGCAIVAEQSKVIGVFSTTDALRVLLEHLD